MSTENSSSTVEKQETTHSQSDETTSASELSLRDQLAAELDKSLDDTPEGPVVDVATDAQVEAVTETETPAPEVLEPPARWSAADREKFAKLSREAQEIVLERHREMEADYTRKTMELAEQRKPLDEFAKIFEPYKQQLELAGRTPAQVTQQLLAAQKFLETNPLEGLKWLAQSYNIDLNNLVQPKADETYTDPELKSLRDELNQLKQERQRESQMQKQAEAQAIQKQINDFKDSKDANGQPKYPHFDRVRSLMGPLVAEGKTLEQAYELASYTLPEVRERIASEAAKAAQAEAFKKAEEARKAKAKEVRGATQVIRSRGPTDTDTKETGTLRQELERALKEVQTGRI